MAAALAQCEAHQRPADAPAVERWVDIEVMNEPSRPVDSYKPFDCPTFLRHPDVFVPGERIEILARGWRAGLPRIGQRLGQAEYPDAGVPIGWLKRAKA